MNRDELVEVTKQAVADWWQTPEGQAASVGEAAAVVAALERLLRGDERNRILTEDQALGSLVRKDERMLALADLRAKVEARRMEAWDEFRSIDFPGKHVRKRALSERAKALQDVLDLIDGVVE